MKKRNIIKGSNFRFKSPVLVILVLYLCFDKWDAPEWLWGIGAFLSVLLVIAFIVDMFNTTEIDIFNDRRDKTDNS